MILNCILISAVFYFLQINELTNKKWTSANWMCFFLEESNALTMNKIDIQSNQSTYCLVYPPSPICVHLNSPIESISGVRAPIENMPCWMWSNSMAQRPIVVARLVLVVVVLGHYSDCLDRLLRQFLTSFSAICFSWFKWNSRYDYTKKKNDFLLFMRSHPKITVFILYFSAFVINIPNIQVFRNVLTIVYALWARQSRFFFYYLLSHQRNKYSARIIAQTKF